METQLLTGQTWRVLFTCAGLAPGVMCREGGGAVRVGWFGHRVVPHCAAGHGGGLDVRAHRGNAGRTCVLSCLAVGGGQLSGETGQGEKAETRSVETFVACRRTREFGSRFNGCFFFFWSGTPSAEDISCAQNREEAETCIKTASTDFFFFFLNHCHVQSS